MTSCRSYDGSINNRNFTAQVVSEAIVWLRDHVLPARITTPRQRQRFVGKWQDFRVLNDELVSRVDNRVVVPHEEIERVLTEAFNDPAVQAGRDRLYRRLKGRYIGISRRDVMKFLKKQETWQVHQPVKREGLVNQPIIVKGRLKHWQMDLIDMQKFAGLNNRFRYALTVIDVFSKYAWTVPIKNKTANKVAAALRQVFDDPILKRRVPSVMQCDNGPEFLGETQGLLRTRGVKQLFSASYKPQTQGGIERFNRTLKRMIFRHFTQFETKRWVDVLPRFVANYNTAVHSATKYAPVCVMTTSDARVLRNVRDKLQQRARKWLNKSSSKFEAVKVGDTVRIAATTMSDERKQTFRPAYVANWSRELYRVTKISKPSAQSFTRPHYTLKNAKGRRVAQRFYRDELQQVNAVELMSNEEERPDYSDGRVFDLERHLREMNTGPRRPADAAPPLPAVAAAQNRPKRKKRKPARFRQ